jgi:multiple sugar transport system permease protein
MRFRSPAALAIRLGKLVAVLLLLGWSLVPILLIVSSSFKPARDIFAIPPRLLFTPTLAHYGELWSQWGIFFKGLVNSVVITSGATLLAVAASLAAGFAYSRRRTPRLASTAALLVGLRLIPPIVITLPLFPIVNRLGLADTHLVLILLYAAFFVSMGSLLMRGFIDQIPRELDEAALVDGAGVMTVLRRVIVPLSVPGMLAVAVFVIVYAWNEFLFAFIFTSTRAKTAPLVLSEMISPAEGVEWGVLFAASTAQLMPVLVFVVFMQRHFVAGLTAGAVKG